MSLPGGSGPLLREARPEWLTRVARMTPASVAREGGASSLGDVTQTRLVLGFHLWLLSWPFPAAEEKQSQEPGDGE